MPGVKLYAPARASLVEIWHYTERTWGVEQADRYLRDLHAAVAAAAGERMRWRAVPHERAAGVYFVRYRHHYVFFRELSDGDLGVISVLHESMDLPERLREDLEDLE